MILNLYYNDLILYVYCFSRFLENEAISKTIYKLSIIKRDLSSPIADHNFSDEKNYQMLIIKPVPYSFFYLHTIDYNKNFINSMRFNIKLDVH